MRELDTEAIARRRASGEFFWLDLDREHVPVDRIAGALELSPAVVAALDSLEDGGSPARRLHVESDLIVFPFWFAANPEAGRPTPTRTCSSSGSPCSCTATSCSPSTRAH